MTHGNIDILDGYSEKAEINLLPIVLKHSLTEVCATLHPFQKNEGVQRRRQSLHNNQLRNSTSVNPEKGVYATNLAIIVGFLL